MAKIPGTLVLSGAGRRDRADVVKTGVESGTTTVFSERSAAYLRPLPRCYTDPSNPTRVLNVPTQLQRTSIGSPHELAEVTRGEFGLRQNSTVACECLLGTIRTSDNRYERSPLAKVVAHTASL